MKYNSINHNLKQSRRTRSLVNIIIPQEVKKELDARNKMKHCHYDDSSLEDSTETTTQDGNVSTNDYESKITGIKRKNSNSQSPERIQPTDKKIKCEETQTDDDTETPTINANDVFGHSESKKEENLRKKYANLRFKQRHDEDDTVSTLTQSSNNTLPSNQAEIEEQAHY